MNPAERENLSALTDGELSPDQVRFMLRRTDSSVVLRATWGRYHVMGDGLRREVPLLADDDFAERVMREIAATARMAAPSTHAIHGRTHHWLRWSAGGAIAAGVAAVALIVVQPQMQPTPVAAPGIEHVAAVHSTPAAVTQPMAAPSVPRWLSASPSAAQLAQPAAADFYGPGRMLQSRGYTRHLSPYMTLPGYRAPTSRQARQVMHQLWSMTPRHASPPQQPVLRIQAQ